MVGVDVVCGADETGLGDTGFELGMYHRVMLGQYLHDRRAGSTAQDVSYLLERDAHHAQTPAPNDNAELAEELTLASAAADAAAAGVHASYRRDLVPLRRDTALVVWRPAQR